MLYWMDPVLVPKDEQAGPPDSRKFSFDRRFLL
jgi:hypothetical protein